jgi:two-component system sensor histidine kinase KdpD
MHANLLRAIAHDIRTPLASILGASSALQEQTLSAEDQEPLVDGIRRDAQWLVRVTENLLSVTRISGDISIRKEDEVLEEIIGSAVHKYRRSPEALPVLVDTQDRILIVPMDGVLIEQVLINLFDNVNAHAAGATQIWLHITTKSNRIILSVEDNGAGVDAARMSRLLEGSPASEHTDSRRGMGIGLTVCRTIVRAHHGEMHVSRSTHGGLAVSFDLPYPQ